jgi:SAM-dependent methyltransferase
MSMAEGWWQGFFDDEYLRLWGDAMPDERTQSEADGLWTVLGLGAGARVLDAPCGYGRLSRALAVRGARVVGVDQSAPLLAAAEAQRGPLDAAQLRFAKADLRQPLDETGFDAAINIFSSLGYGTEADDLAILTTLRRSLRPDGKLFIDSSHRDGVIAANVRGLKHAQRLPDGTLFLEEPRFDPVSGRVDTTWYWHGPRGAGQKSASLRVYAITELVALVERAGFSFVSAHRGCSAEPYRPAGADLGWRVGILATVTTAAGR